MALQIAKKLSDAIEQVVKSKHNISLYKYNSPLPCNVISLKNIHSLKTFNNDWENHITTVILYKDSETPINIRWVHTYIINCKTYEWKEETITNIKKLIEYIDNYPQ